jgi:RNA polymerase sigma factor (sigma-70 family)
MVLEPHGITPSDEDLLTRSIEEPEVFADFYERHGRSLLAYFARRTFDPHTAADLTAETFAQAFESRVRFRQRKAGGGEAWLYTIARRQLARFVRRGRVEKRVRQQLGIPERQLSEDDHDRIERLIDFEKVGRAVARALTKLSSRQRDAVIFRVVEGRPYEEVARLLGCSEQTARARVSRGLHKLSGLLEPGKE